LEDAEEESPPSAKAAPPAGSRKLKAAPRQEEDETDDEEQPAAPPKRKSVPAEEDEEAPAKRARKRPARDAEEDEDELGERPKKGKKKAQKSSPLLVLVVVGGLAAMVLVAAVSVGALWLLGVFDKKSATAQADTMRSPGADSKKGPVSPSKKGGPPINPGGGDPTGGWQVLEAKEWGFKVELPGRAEKHAIGDTVMYLANGPNGGAYGEFDVAVENLSASALEQGPKGVLENCTAFGKILQKKEISLKGHPGIEVSFENEVSARKIIEFHRFYVVNKRLYDLHVRMEQGKVNREDVDRFFNSFQLID
jgi:hypothetical protein